MIKLRIHLVVMLLVAVLFSCKDKPQAEAQTAEPEKTENISDDNIVIRNTSRVDPSEIPAMRSKALGILKYRKEQPGSQAWAILDVGVWQYEFIVKGKNVSKPGELDGQWIDFNTDYTYSYGMYEDTNGSGQYHLDLDANKLLLIDDKASVKPQEFTTKIVNKVMVLSGSSLYRDNNMQVKFGKLSEVPTRTPKE